MAKFCMNCGSPIDEGAVFCDNCGTRVDAPPKAQPVQAPAQQYTQPTQQYSSAQPYIPQQPYQPNQSAPQYGVPQPPKKKKVWPIVLVSAGSAVTVLALVLIIIALVQLSSHRDAPIPTEADDIAAPVSEAPTEDIPDFERYGIVPNLALHDSFDYSTSYEDPNDLVTARMTLDSFSRAPITQDMIDFGLENDMQLEGYEVLKVSFIDILPDDAVEKHIKIIHRLSH